MLSGWTLELFGNFLLPSYVGILMPIERQSNQLDLQVMEGLCVEFMMFQKLYELKTELAYCVSLKYQMSW